MWDKEENTAWSRVMEENLVICSIELTNWSIGRNGTNGVEEFVPEQQSAVQQLVQAPPKTRN